MSLFARKKPITSSANDGSNPPINVVAPNYVMAPGATSMPDAFSAAAATSSQNSLFELVLQSIHDGVIVTSANGVVEYINPAAVAMTGCRAAENAVGLDFGLLLRIETKDRRELTDTENPLLQAMHSGQPLENYQCCLVTDSAKCVPIAVTVLMVDSGKRIITFRNIEKELAEESEKADFISTASHEMRTPVATIDGYVSLALNPQTATIDDRARGYLDSASKAAKHLGKLFQDLLDVTKLDDGRVRPNFVPVEMTETVHQIVEGQSVRANEAGLTLRFGQGESTGESPRLAQLIYSSVDANFLQEILDNLIDNAIKYTAKGGIIVVSILGDNDEVTISVADSGIGISASDLSHVFQKFYRADNSDTREVGGTGLGLYLVKQRAEAMGGHVWAESIPGKGSTFYVSLPRISSDEYEKRMIAVRNAQMINNQGGTK